MLERWLVIDDSSTIQRVIKIAFQDYDVLITEAESCGEGSREILRVVPTLVIVDASVSGVQSTQDFVALRNLAPQVPFIVLEGSYDSINRAQFEAAGFRHFLRKPFDAAQLLNITRQALGRAAPLRSLESNQAPFPPSESKMAPPFQRRGGTDESLTTMPPVRGAVMSGVDLGLGDFGAGSIEASSPGLNRGKESSGRAVMSTRVSAPEAQHEGQPRRSIPLSLDDEDPQSRHQGSSGFRHDSGGGLNLPHISGRGMLEPILNDETERLLRQAVEDYCRKNFASIAREVISSELERLTQERTRILSEKSR